MVAAISLLEPDGSANSSAVESATDEAVESPGVVAVVGAVVAL